MRRKVLMLMFSVLFSIALVGCASSDSNTAKEMKDTLTDAGYVLEARDSDSIAYYEEHVLNDTYGVPATVKELYVGYINETERWVELIVFANGDQAAVYAQAIYAEGATGKLVVVRDSVVLLTYSTDTVNLFPVIKG